MCRLVLLVLLMTSLGAAADTPLATDCSSAEDALETYLAKHHGADSMYVLAFDHRRAPGWWRGYLWDQYRLTPVHAENFDLQPNDVPRLSLPRGEDLGVYVIGTNPLAYGFDLQAPTVADHESVAELQQLVRLLGGALIETVQVASYLAGVEAKEGTEPESQGAMRTLTVPMAQGGPWTEIQRYVAEELEEPLANRLGDLKMASQALGSDLYRASVSMAEVDQRIRETEIGTLAAAPANWPRVVSLEGSFSGVQAALQAIAEQSPSCVGPLSTLQKVLTLHLLPRPSDPRQAADEAKTYEELANELRGLTSGCAPLQRELRAAGVALLASRPTPSGPTVEDRASLEPVHEVVSSYLATVQQRKAMLETSKKVLEKRGPMGKQVARYEILSQRREPFDGMAADCVVHGVLEVPRASGREHRLPWTKVRTDTVKIVFDPSLAEVVPASRPATVEAKYEVTSASSLFHDFDLDFGLTHTDLETPEFGVQAIAGEVPEGEPGHEIILKNRDSRSGEVALFGTWNMGRGFVRGGPQIGVGIDPDQPAFFLGGALAFGRFVKLSAGITSQEVLELSGGHDLRTRVTSADEIRTRETFDESWYAALTISLGDTLSFFTPAEE